MNRYVILGVGAVLVAGAAAAAYTTTRGDRAEVVRSEPITQPETVFGRVLAAEPVRGMSAVPREICSDSVVQERLPERDAIVGYDVTYRYDGIERTVRMNDEPGDSLPVVDGAVVLATDRPGRDPAPIRR